MKNLINYTWCLPQNIIALIIRMFVKVSLKVNYEDATIYYCSNIKSGSLSIGNKIFLCKSHWGNERVIRHEYGHYKQSLILGWLWLLVIGLPSLIWAGCFDNYREKHNINYYSFYTEKWADKLGGVL